MKDSLSWYEPRFLKVKNGTDIEKLYYLTFKGALDENNYKLPVYQKIIPLPYNAAVKIKKTKFTYQTANLDLYGSNLLKPQININTKVFKDRDKYFLIVNFIPLIKRNTIIEKVTSFEITLDIKPLKTKPQTGKYKSNSVLSTGYWVKIGIPRDGVYKITFDQLRQLGFSSPQSVRVFGNDFGQLPYDNATPVPDDLSENKIFYGNDYILFYARGPKHWYYDKDKKMFLRKAHDYSDTAYYFLSSINTGYNNTVEISNEENLPVTDETNQYLWYADYEKNDYNVLHSGRMWFALPSFKNGDSQSFEFDNTGTLNDTVSLEYAFLGRNFVQASVTYSCCQRSYTKTIPAITGILGFDWGKIVRGNWYFLPATTSDLNVNITYNGVLSTSIGLLDYLVINAWKKLTFSSSQVHFSNPRLAGTGKTVKYTIDQAPTNAIVWDITNTNAPKQMPLNFGNNQAWFVAQADSLRNFVLFSPDQALTPIFDGKGLGKTANQNLHATPDNTQMLIITHPDFTGAAEKIAQLHRDAQKINVFVATTNQIYNEFSSGMPDAVALRNYIRFTYQKTNKKLRWVLLLGDGSYNNRYAPKNPNFILTYQTLNSLNTNGYLSLVSDDFFAMLDDNEGEINGSLTGLCDINIGRLPVKTPEEANEMARKIEYYLYHQQPGSWKSYLVLFADDAENNLFMSDAEQISLGLYSQAPQYRIKKIYIDAYKAEINFGGEEYPGAVTDIKNRVEKGSLIISYLGHGNETVLTSERVVTASDVRNWKNLDKLNFFITGTCEFGRFDEYDPQQYEVSGGEYAVLNPSGGAIALLTTTRLSYSSINYFANYGVFDHAFDLDNNRKISLGEIIRRTKTDYNNYFMHEFVLLGDPALSLTYPQNSVRITFLSQDTLKALSYVSLKGEIIDTNQNLIQDFNGLINITVLDKPRYYWTLDNDLVGAFKYLDYKNVLFNGQATVTGGKFEADFIVPKDMDINYGEGKILFYAWSDDMEAMGYKKIITGGLKDTVFNDNTGPQIKLFLNDSSFVNGSVTNDNPKVIAILSDQSGINTTSGIGHELVLELDGKKYFVNEYFVSDKNTYKSGKLEYELYKLEPGKHTLKLKAYDILNNYSEKSIDFYVTENQTLTLGRVFNYPNPFVDNTGFYFEHNQPGKTLSVLINIFTVSGRLVKSINTQVTSDSYFVGPIQWNGLDDYGHKIGRGVYFYILTVKSSDGSIARFTGKLLKI